MIVANIKSPADLQAKKDLQKQLIELEVSNEEERQKRFQERGIRETEGKKLVEQYRTPAEIKKDIFTLEKKALDLIIELGFNYAEAGQLTNWLSGSNKLAPFISNFKTIKKDIQEGYDKSIVDTAFLENYLDNFFEDLDVNLGKKFSKDITHTPSDNRDFEKLAIETSTREQIKNLTDTLINIVEVNNDLPVIMRTTEGGVVSNPAKYSNVLMGKVRLAIQLLEVYFNLLPSSDFYNNVRLFSTQNERQRIAKNLSRAFRTIGVLSERETNELETLFTSALNELQQIARKDDYINYLNDNFLSNSIDRLIRTFSNIKTKKYTDVIKSIYEDFDKVIKSTDKQYSAMSSDLEDQIRQIAIDQSKDLILQFENELGFKREQSNLSRTNEKLREQDLYSEAVVEKQKQKLENEMFGQQEAESFKNQQSFKQELIERIEGVNEYINEMLDDFADLPTEQLRENAFKGLIVSILKTFPIEVLPEDKREILSGILNKKGLAKKNKERIISILKKTIEEMFKVNPNYDPRQSNTPIKIKDKNNTISIDSATPAGKYGLGVLSKLKKHFKGDEKLLQKVVKALQDDSSSDEEENKELARQSDKVLGKGYDRSNSGFNKNNFATAFSKDTIEANFKNLGGVGLAFEKGKGGLGRELTVPSFKATRIPVSKVGKGVKLENQENPTYRQFGKYVLHIPHLVNSNTANFKYPSLGSIPSIKPLSVSDDYKDLILDVLQTGKLNKKEFERLPQSEIKHFERVAVGAGLVEQLGLKLGNTEEDKADSKRFELLRGEYLAGNNNQALIKELRLLITKFITNGRIHKNEGLNLLLELSTI